MKPRDYHNEIDPYAAQWIRNLMKKDLIPDGFVDERDIRDVQPMDLWGFTRCHWFAGIGGWSLALRLAGVPDDFPLWTGSCPCQSFSAAGARKGFADERHLWPAWFHLINQHRPQLIFGEQVEAAIGHGWLDLVFADLEGQGYACGAAVLPACGVGAPHIRQRVWFVADADGGNASAQRQQRGGEQRFEPQDGGTGELADALLAGRPERRPEPRNRPIAGRGVASSLVDSAGEQARLPGRARQSGSAVGDADRKRKAAAGRFSGGSFAERQRSPWAETDWLDCRDGKRRPVEPGTFPLAHGISYRMDAGGPLQGKSRTQMLRGYGNAIVPQVAAEFIAAFLECRP